MSKLHVVWFKRDLRVHDHPPLSAAVASGEAVLPLYIFEPEYWSLPVHSRRQFDFACESLVELNASLEARDNQLVVRTGPALDVLRTLHETYGLAAIHVSEDAGLEWTAQRDAEVRRFCLQAGIAYRAYARHGLPPAEDARAARIERWEKVMHAPRLKAPEKLKACLVPTDSFPSAHELGLTAMETPGRQLGGRKAGVEALKTFLTGRGRDYRRAMSSPLTAADTCSRLSPHFAFGTVSLREAFQAGVKARAACLVDGDSTYAASIESFLNRLRWHGDFVQRAAEQAGRSATPIVSRPVAAPGDPRLAAWIEGRTGFPFIDACMRSLRETGWLNFRARAMLLGFATHHLWLDEKAPAEKLAALFTDFEPAIHFAQVEMQSASTDMDVPRVYNPVKQSLDQDADGVFIREWVPELVGLDAPHIHAPWDAPKAELARAGIIFGQSYPMRIVDHIAAAREAREKLFTPRRRLEDDVRQLQTVRPVRSTRSLARAVTAPPRLASAPRVEQLSLDLGRMQSH